MTEQLTSDLLLGRRETRLGRARTAAALSQALAFARTHWLALSFGAVALIGAAFAFAGLQVSNYWTDELFSLFVADHGGGLQETLNRALTDTHPPVYYFFLNRWIALFGDSEAVTRFPSAVFAVGAVALFVIGARRFYSPAALAFAAAVAVTGKFWFFQAQNIRNYSLCLFLTAAMFAASTWLAHRREEGRSTLPPLLVLVAVGPVLSLSHFYGLLTTGAIYGLVIPRERSLAIRATLVLWGLVVVGLALAYIHALTTHTQENFHELWFRNDLNYILGILRDSWRGAIAGNVQPAIVVMLAVLLVRPLLAGRQAQATSVDPRPGQIGRFALLSFFGVYLTGALICALYTPSLSGQNMLILSPMVWVLMAWLYDAFTTKLAPRARLGFNILLLALVASELVLLSGRFFERNEAWRESARYVDARAACAREPIPAVRPYKFGPDTPFYRSLSQRYLFGRYAQAPDRLQIRNPAAFLLPGEDPALANLLRARLSGQDRCPILAWVVHDFDIAGARMIENSMARMLEVDPDRVKMKVFYNAKPGFPKWGLKPTAFVLERAQ